MDNDAQVNHAVAVTDATTTPLAAPASLPDPATVDDSDEEDGTL